MQITSNVRQLMVVGMAVTWLAGCAAVGSEPMAPSGGSQDSASGGGSASPMRPASDPVPATDEAIEQAYVVLAESERDIAERWRGRSFEEFEAAVYREPNGGKYIVNGDTPIVDVKHLREYFEKEIQQAEPVERGLIVNTSGGVDTVWDGLAKNSLTYCISDGFGSNYQTVVDAMAAAAGAWEQVADIDFVHASNQDAACTATNAQVVFDTRPVSNQPYLARAFFPDDARGDRNVLIDGSALDLGPGNLTLEGILRHELGHTLGFRHEHTRPDAGTCFEDNNWRPLTSYDAFSVMHYPQCNGAGDWSLDLTAFDQSGAACLYGAAPGFTIDSGICQPSEPPPEPPPCGPQTVTESGSVGEGAEISHGPYPVAPGTQFRAAMSGTGDPDLYVRFRQAPTTTDYDCRPYLSGAMETCELPVPAGVSEAFVMVRGFQAGEYQLEIEHTPGQ